MLVTILSSLFLIMTERVTRYPQDPEACSQDLLSSLVARLQDVRQPPVLRATCAAYAASFLARASFIPDALVVQALQVRDRPRTFRV